MLLAFYVALADVRGVPRARVGGTVQNDCLKEFIAQHAWVVPPRPAMRIVTDMVAFCAAEVPRWNSISISGYHIREAGSTAAQELAFTLANGLEYVRWAVDRGLGVDEFAPRLSFFFDVHSDFFEEIAKFRAARRLWARLMRERFSPRDPRSLMLRTHAQTAGVSLDRAAAVQQRGGVALQALAAVLGGPSLCTPTAWTRPSRCRPKRPRRSRSAPSRSSLKSRARPRRSIRSEAATTSSG